MKKWTSKYLRDKNLAGVLVPAYVRLVPYSRARLAPKNTFLSPLRESFLSFLLMFSWKSNKACLHAVWRFCVYVISDVFGERKHLEIMYHRSKYSHVFMFIPSSSLHPSPCATGLWFHSAEPLLASLAAPVRRSSQLRSATVGPVKWTSWEDWFVNVNIFLPAPLIKCEVKSTMQK